MIRYPFTAPQSLNSTSGPDILVRAWAEALEARPDKVRDINAGPLEPGDIPWHPVWSAALHERLAEGRPVVIGPNVIWANSRAPGAGAGEQRLLQHAEQGKVVAAFVLSRWYAELTRRRIAAPVHLLDFPLPRTWAAITPALRAESWAPFFYVKGGAAEAAIAAELARRWPDSTTITYGAFRRDDLIAAARRHACCIYISREDHFPLAAVEIGLVGCPIISDEKSCSGVLHGVTGLVVPVRERSSEAEFVWDAQAAARLGAEVKAARELDRGTVARITRYRHDPSRCAARAINLIEQRGAS